jgi:hypothetical protein
MTVCDLATIYPCFSIAEIQTYTADPRTHVPRDSHGTASLDCAAKISNLDTRQYYVASCYPYYGNLKLAGEAQ